jgi:hypothetical protein
MQKQAARPRVDVPLATFADESIKAEHPGGLEGRVMPNPPLRADDSLIAYSQRREENK